MAERLFGVTLTNSDGRQVPVRLIGEQHVREDLGKIVTVQDWLENLMPQSWMQRIGVKPEKMIESSEPAEKDDATAESDTRSVED